MADPPGFDKQKQGGHWVRNTIATLMAGGGIGVSAHRMYKNKAFASLMTQFASGDETVSGVLNATVQSRTKTVRSASFDALSRTLDQFYDMRVRAPGVETKLQDLVNGVVRFKDSKGRTKTYDIFRIYQESGIKDFTSSRQSPFMFKSEGQRRRYASWLQNLSMNESKVLKNKSKYRTQIYNRFGINLHGTSTEDFMKSIRGLSQPELMRTLDVMGIGGSINWLGKQYNTAYRKVLDAPPDMRAAMEFFHGKRGYDETSAGVGPGLFKGMKEAWYQEANLELDLQKVRKHRRAIGTLRRMTKNFDSDMNVADMVTANRQSMHNLRDAVLNAQIDLAERIHSKTFSAEPITLLRNLQDQGVLKTHEVGNMRTIRSEESLRAIFKGTWFERNALYIKEDASLAEAVIQTNQWLRKLRDIKISDDPGANVMRDVGFMTGALNRQMKARGNVLFTPATGVGGKVTNPEYLSYGQFKQLIGETEDGMVTRQIDRIAKQLNLNITDEYAGGAGNRGIGFEFLGRKSKTGTNVQGIRLTMGDQGIYIPKEMLLNEKLGVKGFAGSIHSQNVLEVARKSYIRIPEGANVKQYLDTMGIPADDKLLELAERRGTRLIEVPYEVKIMEYINRKLGEQQRISRDEFRTLSNKVDHLTARQSAWQTSGEDLNRMASEMVLDPNRLTTRNPYREAIMGSEGIIDTLTKEGKLYLGGHISHDQFTSNLELAKGGVITQGGQLVNLRANVQEKQIGEIFGGIFTQWLPGGESLMPGSRSVRSGYQNMQMLSDEAVRAGQALQEAGYAFKLDAPYTTQALQELQEGMGGNWSKIPHMDMYGLDVDAMKHLEKVLGADEFAQIENAIAKGQVAVPERLVPALGHYRQEIYRSTELRDIDAINKGLQEGMGVNLGGGTVIRGMEGTQLEAMAVSAPGRTGEYTYEFRRKFQGQETTKLFSTSGYIRSNTYTVSDELFDKTSAALHGHYAERMNIAPEDAPWNTKVMALAGDKYFAQNPEMGLVTKTAYLNRINDIVRGDGASYLTKTQVAKDINNADTITKRARLLGLEDMINTETGALVMSDESSVFAEQYGRVIQALKKAGAYTDIQNVPVQTVGFGVADIATTITGKRTPDLATAIKVWADMPEVYNEMLDGAPMIDELKLGIAPLLENIGAKELEAMATEFGGDILNVVSEKEAMTQIARSTSEFRRVVGQGTAHQGIMRSGLHTDTAHMVNWVKLEESLKYQGQELTHIPIMPRVMVDKLEQTYIAGETPVLGGYDKYLINLRRALAETDPEKRTRALRGQVDSLMQMMGGKHGVIREFIQGAFPSASYMQVVADSKVEDMALRMNKTLKIQHGQSEIEFAEYFAQRFEGRDLKTVSRREIASVISDIQTGDVGSRVAGSMALTETEEAVGAVAARVSGMSYQTQGGIGRNIAEDIVAGRLTLVSDDAGQMALRNVTDRLGGGVTRFPNIGVAPLAYTHFFVDVEESYRNLKINDVMARLHNMDFDNDQIPFMIFKSQKAVKQLRDRTDKYLQLASQVQENWGMSIGEILPEGTREYSGMAMALRAEEAYAKTAGGGVGTISELNNPELLKETRAVQMGQEAWNKLMLSEAAGVGQQRFAGDITRFSERVLFSALGVGADDLMDLSGFQKYWNNAGLTGTAGDEFTSMMFEMKSMFEAIPQEALTPRKAGDVVYSATQFKENLGDTLALAGEAIRSGDRGRADNYLKEAWDQMRPHIIEGWGQGGENEAIIGRFLAKRDSIKEGADTIFPRALEMMQKGQGGTNEVVMSDRLMGVMRMAAVSYHSGVNEMQILDPLAGKNISQYEYKMMQFIQNQHNSFDKGVTPPFMHIGSRVDLTPKGIPGSAKRIAHVGGKYMMPAIAGIASAALFVGMSSLASAAPLDARPERYVRGTDQAPGYDGTYMGDGNSYQLQFTPEPPAPTARLAASRRANVINIEYPDHEADVERINEAIKDQINDVGNVSSTIVREDARSRRTYREYKARREL